MRRSGPGNDGEVAAIERGDSGDLESFGRCLDTTIDRSQGQVSIPAHQFGDHRVRACDRRLPRRTAAAAISTSSHDRNMSPDGWTGHVRSS